jgi:hypothetical protein
MRRCVLLCVFGLSALFWVASAANASPVDSIILSDFSSEESGSTCEPNCTDIVTADQLDATLTFSVVDNLGDLDVTLTLSNDTTAPQAFKINEVYFNLSGITSSSLVAGTLNGWSFLQDGCPVGGSTGDPGCTDMTGSGTKADGFGIYDVALKTNGGNALVAGGTIQFTFTVTGGAGTMAEAFTSELSRDTEAGGALFGFAAAKFIEGPQILCPGEEPGGTICDSGFGATVPEPATAAMVALGLLSLGWMGRRRR